MSRIYRRPMFRGGGKVSSYGNGIASGLADGGKVQPLLVGQHPESAKGPDGREKHFAPLVAGGALLARAAPYIPRAYNFGKKTLQGIKNARTFSGQVPPGQAPSLFGKVKNFLSPNQSFRNTTATMKQGGERIASSGSYSPVTMTPGKPMGILQALRDPARLGQAIRQNPITSFGVAGQVKNIPEYAQTLGGLGIDALQGGANYLLGTEFGKEKPEDDANVEGGPTAAEIESKKLREELYKLRKAQAQPEMSSEEYKLKDITDRKARLKAKAEGYEELLGDGIKKDSIFNAMVEGGSRIYEGEGAGAAIRAANKALDPIQNVKTAARKLALEEDIGIRKAIASARPGTAEQNFSFYKSKYPKASDAEIVEMMTGSASKDLDRKLKAVSGGQRSTVIWANSTYGDSEEYGGVMVTDTKGNKQIADGSAPAPGKKYYDTETDTFIIFDEQGKPSSTTPPK
mgnify:FL=1